MFQLSIEISDKCKALAQTQATLDKKMLLKRGVEGAIRKVLPGETKIVRLATRSFQAVTKLATSSKLMT